MAVSWFALKAVSYHNRATAVSRKNQFSNVYSYGIGKKYKESRRRRFTTADFIQKVLEVYTRSMETIYLSLVHTGSWGYLFHTIPSIIQY